MKIPGIVGILTAVVVSSGVNSLMAQQRSSSADVVNGVLSLIDDNIDFESMLSGMNGEIDFDSMLSGMTRNPGQTGGKRPGSVDKTLDYLAGVYNTSIPGSFGNGFANSSPQKYRYAGIGVLPAVGHVTSNFGYRPSFKRMHYGIDISLQVGDTVRSAMDGTVTRVDVDADGYGLYVVLSHRDGLETRYGHLSRSLVIKGMHVMAGDPIALGGNSGNSTGPHLHFETRRNNVAFDPAAMFDFSMPAGMTRHRNLADLDSYAYQGKPAAGDKFTYNNRPPAGGKATYIVKPGDTVAAVARQAGISTLTLCRLNMLSSTDVLTPGRMLRLR